MRWIFSLAVLAAAILATGCGDSRHPTETPSDGGYTIPSDKSTRAAFAAHRELVYEYRAKRPRLNRKILGEVTDSVMGVPAAPVHSFVWDGDGSEPIQGQATVRIDPIHDTGVIRARWHDEYGEWGFTQRTFVAPDHPSGLRAAPDGTTELISGDAVPVDVYLHGSSTAGGAVLPLLFNHVATWGVAEVTLDGQPFENPYDGPAPDWAAHTMLTVGARDENGQVHTVDGGIFDPTVNPDNGAVDHDDLEFHLVFHDAPGPMTDNFPPPFSFFYHLTFEDVSVSVTQSD